ncbi:methylenetetrahydrofolate reductase [Nilaparvata lugens]|uniref:methylenetetrahydrofolate reductase n=1 Tax=Nilaparvata lugens TaxID=108931 RepID=UPI00193DAC26|nr:methylenetetrahydrofolate reductase [Nilaparvata lugens]
MKITNNVESEPKLFMSMEWSAPKDATPLDDCVEKAVASCKASGAKFCGVTWHCSKFDENNCQILKFSCKIQENGIDVIAHLTPQNLTKSEILKILHHLKKNRIKHIFALKGDVGDPSSRACFSYAKDLVLFIRKKFGNYFKIFVAGYPSGHSDKLDRNLEIQYLRDKVDAGADYIITQTVFNALDFVNFVKKCRKIGISIPIIPGIMPIQNAELLLRLDNKCKFHFTDDIYTALITYKGAEEELIKFWNSKS